MDTPISNRVMMKLVEVIVNPSTYILYFDIFITFDLLKSLGEQGYRALEQYQKIG